MATRRRADNPEKLARALRERKDALEQQAATAAILKVIRRSPGDAQPVFDAIVRSALRLVGGHSAIALRLVDGMLHLVAHSSTSTAGDDALKRYYPQPVNAVYMHGRAIRSRRPYSAADTERVPASMASVKSMARKRGYRSLVVVPMLRDGEPIGSMSVSRKQPGEFSKSQIRTLEAFAEEAVIAIENARLFNETKEALAQQTAAGEILRVMASSPSDVQPVFDAIARNSSRLCNGNYAIVTRFDGELIHLAAQHNPRPNAAELTAQRFPRRPGRDLPSSRAVLEGALVHIPYADEDPDLSKEHFRRIGAKSFLSVPMLKDGVPVGSISVSRAERGPFPPTQIELMKLFADQAVMAIENVRLFNETKEALERQTATSEVLRVISRTPADAQPVFEAIAQSAVRLFDAPHAGVVLVEGESLRLKATSGYVDPRGQTLIPFDRTSTVGRTLLDKEIVDVPDTEAPGAPAFARSSGRVVGFRAVASAPMLRDGNGIGAIMVQRARPGALTAKQRELLQTFADQAVIAIENARLFNETKSALARQTATADILRVLGRSITDVQPVFDAIVKNCSDLFEDSGIILRTVSGDELVSRASIGYDAAPVPIDRSSAVGACVLEGRTIHFPDIEQAAKEFPRVRQLGLKYGFHSGIYAPLKRADKAIGAICVLRRALGAFDEKEVELLTTFADQAVIAIENVRLFNETKEALEHQQASADILRIVSQSVADSQPAFEAILAAVRRLFDGFDATVWRLETDRLVAVARGGPTHPSTTGHSVPATLDHVYGIAIRERRPVQIDDVATSHEINELSRQDLRSRNRRAVLLVPFVRDGDCVGAISVSRSEPHGFSEKQVALLKNFAAQAVIAIENTRLFKETKEALEQQTATAEILRVISSSPTETQPVFEAIVQSAVRLFAPCRAVIVMREGDLLQRKAAEGALANIWPLPFDPERSMAARCIIERRIIEIPDTEAPGLPPVVKTLGRAAGYRAVTVVPLLREGEGVGVIGLHRPEPGFKLTEKQLALVRTFADQAVIAIENSRLFNETNEALERQTATAEILKVISASPTDVQPVFDAIARSAVTLCGGLFGAVFRYDGEQAHFAAHYGFSDEARELMLRRYPRVPQGLIAPTIFEGAVSHSPDTLSDSRSANPELHRALGVRGFLGVPMLLEGRPIGCICVFRREPGPFADAQIAVLQTFADQAVIAIENVRLFNETKEALERQTAISEILRVISGSPADIKPVLDTVAAHAARICHAQIVDIALAEGPLLRIVASVGDAGHVLGQELPLDRSTGSGRSIVDRAPVHVVDMQQAGNEFPLGSELARKYGIRTILGVPLLREGRALGSIMARRGEVRPFEDKDVALLKTFADQAAIAIENARLFNETKEALERQTATAEILKVISASPTDVQPVFDAIAERAAVLCGAKIGVVTKFDGELLHLVAFYGASPDLVEPIRAGYPVRPGSDTVTARAVRDCAPAQIPDLLADPDYVPKQQSVRAGYRSNVAVPLLREGKVIGALSVARAETGVFSEREVGLLQTFADQAVIAIENTRLFNELEARTQALTRSVRQLTVLGEVGQAIGSTLELETVLKTIVIHAVKLSGVHAGIIYEYDETRNAFDLRASEGFDEESLAGLREAPIRVGVGAVGRAVATRTPTAVPDTHAPDYPRRFRQLLDRQGFRAVLAVPLTREERTIGALMVVRKSPGAFAPEIVELLGTLGTQSALAIQNARLYREIEQKSRELETASRHKSQFLASMSHELRTPLNAILGFNEMILDQVYGEVPPDVQEPLQNIQSSGKHLLGLINNVLDLAKIEAGRMELALSDYSVQDTVASVHSTLKPLAAEKGLDFVAEVPADIPPAHGDPGRVAQCLMNLAGNSLKFTKQGRVAIAVARSDGLLRFSVADTGIGIPADKISSLFTEFKQTDATIASEYGGTGLGLSITKKFIEMHGGKIWVESEPGKGSTFLFEIPLRAEQ